MAKSAILFRVCTLAFFLAEVVRADGSQCRPNGEYSTAINRLRNDILCSYDVFVRPVRQYNDTVDVKVRLSLRRIQFDERRDSLEVHSLFLMNWIDYHFVWEPAKYDNIDNLHVASNTIWIPDIGVFTSADETSFSLYKPPTICIIYNDGIVVCAPASTHTASCSADLTHWPYDRHTCNLVMGSWTHTGEKVNVSLMERSINFNEYNMNREWELISMTSYRESGRYECCPNDTFPSVTFQLVLQRHSGSYTAIVVSPAIVLMLMTLVTWTKGDQSARLMLAIIDVFTHFLFLQYLGSLLPANGDSTPLIVTFYRDSMILATMALLTAIFVRGLRRTSISLPVWISGLSSWIVGNRFGQVLIFHNLDPKGAAVASEASGEEGANLVDVAGSQPSDWGIFTSLLDLTCFVITLVTYFVLILGFMP